MDFFIKNKSGKISSGIINTTVLSLVLVVVLFNVYATITPTAQTAGNSMGNAARCAEAGCVYNATDTAIPCHYNATMSTGACNATQYYTPLASLFAGSGIVFLIVMAALIVLVVRSFIAKK